MFGTVDEIIEALGGTAEVAKALDLGKSTVSSWRKRASIPAERWAGVVALAKSKDISMTFEALAAVNAAPPAEVRP